MKIQVVLEFDENDLGQKWMNPDNLDILLYTENSTKKELLKVLSFEEMGAESCQLDTIVMPPPTENDKKHSWNNNTEYIKNIRTIIDTSEYCEMIGDEEIDAILTAIKKIKAV